MAQIGIPIDGITYTAEDASIWFFGRTNGVFALEDNLKVTSAEGMYVNILEGGAWLTPNKFRGIAYALKGSTTSIMQKAHDTLHRIDRIVIRWNIQQSGKAPSLGTKIGTPSLYPVAPDIERNESVWELALADVRINAGTTVITDDMITDLRPNRELCGFVSDGVMSVLDTELTDHKQTTAFSEEGVHGLRVVDGIFQAWDGYEWIDIAAGSGEQQERLPSGNAHLTIRTEIREREEKLGLEGITYVIAHNTSGKAITKKTNVIGSIGLSNIAPGSYTVAIYDELEGYFVTEPQTVDIPDAGMIGLSFAITGEGMPLDPLTFTESGVWQVPENINFVDVWLVGGGAGAMSNANYGGGGGGYAHLWRNVPVTPGETIPFVVGLGGEVDSGGGQSYFRDSSIFANGGYTSMFQMGGSGGSGGGGGASATNTVAGNGGNNGDNGTQSTNIGGYGQAQGNQFRRPINPYNNQPYSGGGSGGIPTTAGYVKGMSGIGEFGKGGNRGIDTEAEPGNDGVVIIYPLTEPHQGTFEELNAHIYGWLIDTDGSFTVPEWCDEIDVFAIGGGGSGGSAEYTFINGNSGTATTLSNGGIALINAEGGKGGTRGSTAIYLPTGNGGAGGTGSNPGQAGGDGANGGGGGASHSNNFCGGAGAGYGGGTASTSGGGGGGGYGAPSVFGISISKPNVSPISHGGSGDGAIERTSTIHGDGGNTSVPVINYFNGFKADPSIKGSNGGTAAGGNLGSNGGMGYGAGGGSGCGSLAKGAGGGGSGFFVFKQSITVTPGEVLTAEIGKGGAALAWTSTSGGSGAGRDGCVHIFPRLKKPLID